MSLLVVIFFWLLTLTFCEVCISRRLVDLLTGAFLLVFLLAVILLQGDLDTLSALVLLTYASVFLLLTLLIFQVGPYDVAVTPVSNSLRLG